MIRYHGDRFRERTFRHTNISTKTRFYVGVSDQGTADELWRVESDIPGNSDPETATAKSRQST
jgi:hypothetical protein